MTGPVRAFETLEELIYAEVHFDGAITHGEEIWTHRAEFERIVATAKLAFAPRAERPAADAKAFIEASWDRCTSCGSVEEAKLVAFFRSPEGDALGRQGDHDNLSPAETAIRAMRSLSLPSDGGLWQDVAKLVDLHGGKAKPEEIVASVKSLREAYAGMCDRLHDAVKRHKLGLGGEHVDALVIEELDRLSQPSDGGGHETKDALVRQRDALCDVLWWALGEKGEFPSPPDAVPGKPIRRYYWRKEMRERFDAALAASHPSARGTPNV